MHGGKMWSSLKGSLSALFVVPLLFLCGCVTYNAATGRNEMIFVSTASEVQMGNQADREISAKNKILKDTPESKRLETLGQRVARISDRQDIQYRFHLIESDELNAYTVPGGHIYFYTGLFRKLATDDQIASVLAHEIGHCAAKHTIKRFQAAMQYNVARNVALRVLAWKVQVPGVQNIAALGADGIMNLAMGSYSRHDEYEADRLGIKYLYLAGFNLDGMIQAFEVLKVGDNTNKAPLILRTHPFIKDRIDAIKKEIPAVKEKY